MTPTETEKIPYGEGIYRRKIHLASDGDAVLAVLEDDFHHFRVKLRHDGKQVIDVEGEALRFPWTTCPGAAVPLKRLIGLALTPRISAVVEYSNPHEHCTHMFDLASLAVTHAAAGRSTRTYEIEIPDRKEKTTRPTLSRDGEEVLVWSVKGRKITDPDVFSGQSLGKGFIEWADSQFDPDTAEAAITLRRACSISLGRDFDLDQIPHAKSLASLTLGACYTFMPGVIEEAERMFGSGLELTHSPDRLLR